MARTLSALLSECFSATVSMRESYARGAVLSSDSNE
jgi:hypothetical protein